MEFRGRSCCISARAICCSGQKQPINRRAPAPGAERNRAGEVPAALPGLQRALREQQPEARSRHLQRSAWIEGPVKAVSPVPLLLTLADPVPWGRRIPMGFLFEEELWEMFLEQGNGLALLSYPPGCWECQIYDRGERWQQLEAEIPAGNKGGAFRRDSIEQLGEGQRGTRCHLEDGLVWS